MRGCNPVRRTVWLFPLEAQRGQCPDNAGRDDCAQHFEALEDAQVRQAGVLRVTAGAIALAWVRLPLMTGRAHHLFAVGHVCSCSSAGLRRNDLARRNGLIRRPRSPDWREGNRQPNQQCNHGAERFQAAQSSKTHIERYTVVVKTRLRELTSSEVNDRERHHPARKIWPAKYGQCFAMISAPIRIAQTGSQLIISFAVEYLRLHVLIASAARYIAASPTLLAMRTVVVAAD